MTRTRKKSKLHICMMVAAIALTACGGGGSGSTPDPVTVIPPPPPPPPPPPAGDGVFDTENATARFLTQATFGPKPEDIASLTGTSGSQWFVDEINKPASLNLDFVLNELSLPGARDSEGNIDFGTLQTPTYSFWINAVEGNDQLRQRMAFALSQILVISAPENSNLFQYPSAVSYYQDVLTRNAFGNYRDLLEEVTYAPAMGEYLTYLENTKGDPETGQVPDENYAREIMQLFSIGLVELNMDGSPVSDADGLVETYTNADVTGLARVFTGLSLNGDQFYFADDLKESGALHEPMKAFLDFHSDLEKRFLGAVIPANTGPEESIDIALDTLVNHDNTAPFIARQLIQRFITSHPAPDYVERVANSFAAGRYTLPDGQSVGDGRRGDLSATLAAILFDEDAREASSANDDQFGKVREPVIRFTHWARTFDAGTVTPKHTIGLQNTGFPFNLAQGPYKAPSVFNFYRPGYIAPGTETGAANLTMPELQLVNANTVTTYSNFMSYFIFAIAEQKEVGPEATSFIPDYTEELALADDPAALVDHLDLLLTYGSASENTKSDIESFITDLPLSNPNEPEYDGATLRVSMAILMLMTSPDYLVQR